MDLTSLGGWIDADESMLINPASCNPKGGCAAECWANSSRGCQAWAAPVPLPG